jgi:hypothetical protein
VCAEYESGSIRNSSGTGILAGISMIAARQDFFEVGTDTGIGLKWAIRLRTRKALFLQCGRDIP